MDITVNTSLNTGIPDAAFLQGWDADLDLGTTGDMFVDAVSGSDGNNGLTSGAAKATIGAAITAASAGDTIRVMGDGVKYRELVVPITGVSDVNRTEILGYSTHKPIITAADALTGFTQCSAADSAVLGSVLGVASSPVYKRTGLAKTSIADSDPRALNIHEDNIGLDLVVDWAGGDKNAPFFQANNGDWHTATTVNQTSGDIDGYILASVTDEYTQTQIENAFVFGHTSPNAHFYSEIASFDTGTDSIVLADQTNPYYPSPAQDKFALFNILPNMTAGTWGYTDDGSTVTVYVYPNTDTNNIEYSARVHCVNLSGLDHVTLRGLDCRHAAGTAGTRSGSAIVDYLHSTANDNKTIENCRVYGTYSQKLAAIHIAGCSNLTIDKNTVENGQGSFGVYVSAQVKAPLSDTVFSDGVSVSRNKLTKFAQSSLRFYTVKNCVIAHNLSTNCSQETHSNKINFYEQSHACLAWGNRFVGCGGYATYQEASGVSFGFNYFDTPTDEDVDDTNSLRGFVDQNNNTAPPIDYIIDGLASYIFNNTILPDASGVGGTAANGMSITTASSNSDNDNVKFIVANNLYHGHSVRSADNITSWGGNWTTNTTQGAYNGADTAATYTAVYTDPDNGDFSIKAGAAIRSGAGDSLVTDIAVLTAIHGTRFTDWDLDAFGATFTAATPPVGASVAFS